MARMLIRSQIEHAENNDRSQPVENDGDIEMAETNNRIQETEKQTTLSNQKSLDENS